MRFLESQAVNSYLGRIQLAFTLTLFISSQASVGKQALSLKLMPAITSPMQKAHELGFPSLPQAILGEITGKKREGRTSSSHLDKKIGHSWGLVNIGFFEVFSPLIHPVSASVSPCSDQIIVAVIDTGIDYTHPELMGSVWVNPGESGTDSKGVARHNNGKDDDGDGYIDDVVGWDFVNNVPLPMDTHGHGSHISGIIAGNAANGMGVSGVCPRVTIMPLKYYDNSGIGFNNLQNTVRAIHFAVKHGAHVINYSGGGSEPAATERAAIEEAQRKGALFVAAAGNDSHNNDRFPYFPASYELDNIVSVASVNKEGQLLPSSNFGPKSVHIAAPGLSIMSSLPQNRFGTMSGTSQATAFVTGAAALLASQMKNFEYKRIKRWLVESSKPFSGNEKKQILVGGLLSIPQALSIQREELSKPTPTGTSIAQRPDKENSNIR